LLCAATLGFLLSCGDGGSSTSNNNTGGTGNELVWNQGNWDQSNWQ